jgi:hypothetical protein
VKAFGREMMYGPIFPCVCCHCLYFKDQVVPFNPDKIEAKAKQAHQVILNMIKFECKLTNNPLTGRR